MDADRMTGQKWVVTGLSRLSGEREVISSPHSRWKAEALVLQYRRRYASAKGRRAYTRLKVEPAEREGTIW